MLHGWIDGWQVRCFVFLPETAARILVRGSRSRSRSTSAAAEKGSRTIIIIVTVLMVVIATRRSTKQRGTEIVGGGGRGRRRRRRRPRKDIVRALRRRLAGLGATVVDVEAGREDAERTEEGADDLPSEGDVREGIPAPDDDLDQEQEQHEEDVLTHDRDDEDDDDHDQVQRRRPSSSRLPHLDALLLRSKQKARGT